MWFLDKLCLHLAWTNVFICLASSCQDFFFSQWKYLQLLHICTKNSIWQRKFLSDLLNDLIEWPDTAFMLHFCEYWDIRVAGAPKATLSVPYLLSKIPLMRTLEPLFCTFCGYSGYTSLLKPLSLHTRLAEPFTTNKADRAFLLHFVWIVWTYQSAEATTYLLVTDF